MAGLAREEARADWTNCYVWQEVGQLRGWHPHLGSSLEVITMSNPHAPEADPEKTSLIHHQNCPAL